MPELGAFGRADDLVVIGVELKPPTAG